MARTKHIAFGPKRRRTYRGQSPHQTPKQAKPNKRGEKSSSAPADSSSTQRGRDWASSSHTTPGGSARKPHRFRPGTVALREIRKFQKSCSLLVPAAPFIRTVREITGYYSKEVCRWTPEALIAIQEAAEDFIVHLFEDANLCAIHAKRVTLNASTFRRCYRSAEGFATGEKNRRRQAFLRWTLVVSAATAADVVSGMVAVALPIFFSHCLSDFNAILCSTLYDNSLLKSLSTKSASPTHLS
ncbi:uncharacterized protein LOC144708465 isoform X2 [Wolffia australiana]